MDYPQPGGPCWNDIGRNAIPHDPGTCNIHFIIGAETPKLLARLLFYNFLTEEVMTELEGGQSSLLNPFLARGDDPQSVARTELVNS
jgi:hypothetical protein